MKKVVVIAGQSGADVVKEFQCLGIKVLLVCGKEKESGCNFADEVFICDLSQVDKISLQIKKFSNFVFFGTGHDLAINLAKSCSKLGFVINFDPFIAGLFKNKVSTHKFISDLGFKTPLIRVLKKGDNFIPVLPVVLKAEIDSYKTEMISFMDDFFRVRDLIWASGSSVLVEKFIDGVEVTLPVIAKKGVAIAKSDSLDMKGINEKAVSILKGFDVKREEKILNLVSVEMKKEISDAAEAIISKSKYYGYPRFDIMVKGREFFILEINSIMVTATGGAHYPWHDVGLNPAKDMVELFLDGNL